MGDGRWAALIVIMDSSMNKSGVCSFAAATSSRPSHNRQTAFHIELQDGGKNQVFDGCDRRLVAYLRWALVICSWVASLS